MINAVACAEAGRGLSFANFPCTGCPKVHRPVDELLHALSAPSSPRVVRVFDYQSKFTKDSYRHVAVMLSAAAHLHLSTPLLAVAPHLVHVGLWRLMLEPSPRLADALSAYRVPPDAVGVHVRSGDSGMVRDQIATPEVTDPAGARETHKCGITVQLPEQRQALLECVGRIVQNRTVVFATDYPQLALDAASYFGSQLMQAPGAPRHTFRPMDKLRNATGSRKPSSAAAAPNAENDPHMKQMLDFVLLGSTSVMLKTCGTFGDGAVWYNSNARQVSPLRC
mmetsp:Transcript_5730/g.15255  ORF Transcript_5730/g.15255 Transcript_5730/m.15255 type:complete len:280 (-) Transcript_5730:302-1141(-)